MREVVTAVVTFIAARVATTIGSLLPGVFTILLIKHPVSFATVHQFTIPSVMMTAALFGWMISRWHPMVSLKAVVFGLVCFTLFPLLALAEGFPLLGTLLGCAAEALVSLSFVFPIAWAGGMVATVQARLSYVVAACTLLPFVAWWASSGVGASVISVAPLLTRVENSFKAPAPLNESQLFRPSR